MTARSTVDTLRDYLAKGVTGSLRMGGPDQAPWQVFLMQGEILAAHGPDDGAWLIRRLVNNGALSAKQGEHLLRALIEDERFEELLMGQVPDGLFLDLLTARFRQNMFEFLLLEGDPTFTSMDAIFVDNIQVGHDSQALLQELTELWERVRGLASQIDTLWVRPGPAMPTRQEEARLQDLCEQPLRLRELLDLSPYEPGHTLSIVQEMTTLGGLLAEPEQAEVAPEAHEAEEPQPISFEEDDPVTQELSKADREVMQTVPAPSAEHEAETALGTEPLDTWDEEEPSAGPEAPAADDELLNADTLMEPEGLTEEPPEQEPSLLDDLDDLDDLDEISELDLFDDISEVTSPNVHMHEGREADLAGAEEEEEDDDEDASGGTYEGETLDDTDEGPQQDNLSHVEAAIERARRIESRRAAARQAAEQDDDGLATHPPAPVRPNQGPPPGDMDDLPPTALDVFLEREDARGAGQGIFTLESKLLDYVDLSPQGIRDTMSQVEDEYDTSEIVELGDAESLSAEELAGLVTLNLQGPRLDEQDVRLKISVASEVLEAVAEGYDRHRGRGAGLATVQLLVEGAPSKYAVLFYGVEVSRKGGLDADDLLDNLKRRPEAEHRDLINRGVLNLIERALSTSVEELPEEAIEPLLQQIAGYQKRLGR